MLLCQPFLNKITRKGLFGRPYARAIDLIDVEERLYSIGAALGHVMRNKLNILVKLLFVPGVEDNEINRIMRLCKKDTKKNLEEFRNKNGRDPNTFGDFISYRSVENLLRNEGIRLSAKDASKAYTQGDRKIKKLFEEKVDLDGIERLMFMALLQGTHFGSSFSELTEIMYQGGFNEYNDSWGRKWAGLVVLDDLKPWSLEETKRAVLQMVAAYTSEYYPELLDPLELRGYLDVEGMS